METNTPIRTPAEALKLYVDRGEKHVANLDEQIKSAEAELASLRADRSDAIARVEAFKRVLETGSL